MPAQGNIKVKRRSIQLLDSNQSFGSTTDLDQISDTEEPTRAEVRNPRKLSQYFPELTLVTNAGS
jgi:glutamine amidotransferase